MSHYIIHSIHVVHTLTHEIDVDATLRTIGNDRSECTDAMFGIGTHQCVWNGHPSMMSTRMEVGTETSVMLLCLRGVRATMENMPKTQFTWVRPTTSRPLI